MISVVLASCRSDDLLAASASALWPQCQSLGAELIVARAAPADSTGRAPSLPDGIRLVPCPSGSTIPEIRGAGLAAAAGEWVALTEDNCVADHHWLTELARGFDGTVVVVGGAMGNAHPARGIDGGAAYAEYGFFGPLRESVPGAMPLVTGANVAYHRRVVPQVAAWAEAGDWEDVIHGRLAGQGDAFAVIPTARVDQNLHYRLGAFCRDRYQHGRDYARVRSRTLATGRRLVLAMTTPLLAPLLAARIWRSAGRAEPAAFLRALPWTLTFLAAWASGEAAGYLTPRSTA